MFGTKDVFVNIAGGVKVEDPSIDLAVICALYYQVTKILPLSHNIYVLQER
jgi:DNA repair protein RadA/Sms